MELDETKINVSLDMEDYTMDELIDLCNVLYRLDLYRPARDIEMYLIRKRNKPKNLYPLRDEIVYKRDGTT